MGLEIIPITQREAFSFVAEHHRHHEPPRGSIINVAVARDGVVVAVAIVGRPGWFQWYCRWCNGRRSPDDDRQIGRWSRFRARHMGGLMHYSVDSPQLKRR